MSSHVFFTETSESDAVTSYPLRRIVADTHTSAGVHAVVGESDTYGTMLFLDGELQSAEADEHIYHESLVHPAMAAARAALGRPVRSVLVVGAGEGATVREVLRWAPEHVDWVDYDRDLVDLCRLHLRWAPTVMADSRVRFQAADIQVALPALGDYDVIILDLPDPDGDTGYLYSAAFWRDLHTHLVPGGYIVTHCGPVRPFGNVGEGFQRVWCSTGEAGMRFDPTGFYPMIIPSFQGTWGFWMWSRLDSDVSRISRFATEALPADLRVVDADQLVAWSRTPRVWTDAIAKSWPPS
jgi:spermidine synthase